VASGVKATWSVVVVLAACGHPAHAPPSEPLRPNVADADVDPADDAPEEVDAGPPEAGAALAPTLVAKIDGVVALAVDGTDVYALSHLEKKWRVWRASKSGGAAAALDDYFASRVSFAVDDERIYVATTSAVHLPKPHGVYAMSAYGRVVAAPKGGGTRRVLFDAPFAAASVSTSNGEAYWLSGKLRAPDDFVLESVLKASATHGATSDVAIGQYGATSVVADVDGAYWSVEGVPNVLTHAWPPGKIVRSGSSRGRTIPVATTEQRPRAMTLDGDELYFLEGDSTLAHVGKQGGAVTTVTTGASAYVVDASFVWWVGDHTIQWAPKSGQGASGSLHVDDGVTAIAVDAERIYYATPTEVWRVTKAVATK
jgi:hypothetical protein